jgi:hypothetical protein
MKRGCQKNPAWDRLTNIREDPCAKLKQDVESIGPGCYETTNFFRWCTTPQQYSNYNYEPGHYQKVYYDACSVNADSDLRSAPLTNPRVINQLFTPPYLTVPYMGPGRDSLNNKDLESELLQGMEDTHFNACGNLSEITIDRFQCLPNFIAAVQDPIHIIPTWWVNGGMPTRDLVRSVNYNKYCLNQQNMQYLSELNQGGYSRMPVPT